MKNDSTFPNFSAVGSRLGSKARHHRVMTLRHLSTNANPAAFDAGSTSIEALSSSTLSADVQATLCATMLDEWVRAGVTRAVVSPGSRSTPMALAIAAETRIELFVVVDERSASFLALGMAKASGTAVILLCTSGTAAVEYHPAVVEADLDHVPLIVCTADRPKELHGIGAPQTVDQQHLYGRSARLFLDLPVAEFAVSNTWRSTAARIALAAMSGHSGPGPVQVNFGFREPLVGTPALLPVGRSGNAPWHRNHYGRTSVDPVMAESIVGRLRKKRGVIVAGAGCGDPAAINGLAARLGWPVLADARSGLRCDLGSDLGFDVGSGSGVSSGGGAGLRACKSASLVANADSILRNGAWATAHRCDVALRFGAPWASKVVNEWLAGAADDLLVDPWFAWLDPNRVTATHLGVDPSALCWALIEALETSGAASDNNGSEGDKSDWLDDWCRAEAAASKVLGEVLDGPAVLASPTIAEPALARALVRTLGENSALVVSSSMPIRDVEWFGGAHGQLRVLANRGANGIDGVLSTAMGVAAVHPGPTVCLIGDLAFLHDVGALSIAAQGRINATLVIVDNRGGGIFEFLPQATGVARDRFELLYGTEQHVNLADVCRAFGLRVTEAASISEVLVAANNPPSGVQVVLVHTNRQTNVEVHRALNDAIVESIDSL
jgi:2-succinyl-5-enolpyruvyl-6-hydroxy-3-cyclohexene-1-carboxylate synthase